MQLRPGPKPKPNTRNDLIEAGIEILHAGGYSASGVQEIVAAANVPKGSFYNYFESKEAFSSEVLDVYFTRNLEHAKVLLRDERTPPLERLVTYFEERCSYHVRMSYKRGCLLGNLSLEVADHSSLIRERLAVHFAAWTALLEECIASAQKDGFISNPLPARTLAEFVLNAWEGALVRSRAEQSVAPLETFKRTTFGSLLV
jgi:TetR/AcrR family transcriptional regulator, transcriptional repressor for nem operon